MSIYLSHRSAFEYWRANDPLPNLGPARARPLPGERPSKSEVDALDVRRFGVSAAPVHVAVAGANDRSQAKGLTCHVLSEPVRPGAFPRVEEGLYVASPEQAFMDMSVELPLVELVRFGYLLCGTYVFDSGGGGFRRRLHGSPTTVEALRERAEGARGERGVNRATRALRYVANGSASPMETNLAMALCLPRMLGGYGFELPQLNARIEARAHGSLMGRSYFECDLYWEEHKTAVEYDSAQFHSGSKAEARDSSRRSGLLIRDVLVITVTTDQFFDARKLDEAARALAKRMGKRLPANNASWMMKRYELRAGFLQDLPGPRQD